MANGRLWTDEEIKILEQMYSEFKPVDEIAERLGRKRGGVISKAEKLGFCDKYIRPNNPKFKAIYQDYDWCYERYINRGMTMQEMADEAGCKLRVMQKWCQEKFNLDNRSYKTLKRIDGKQLELIIAGTLGDGHIDKREQFPMYIEVHAEDEKDYIFWKYDVLKNLCNHPPVYKEPYIGYFNGKPYPCQGLYRFETRSINQLLEVRKMSRIEKLDSLTELGFCTWILDDGSRRDLWELCVAQYSDEEVEHALELLKSKYNIIGKRLKDDRYVLFNADSSRLIDKMILANIPNNLDIIHKKILDNKNITKRNTYIFIMMPDGTRKSLTNYCHDTKMNDSTKDDVRKYLLDNDIRSISENDLNDVITQLGA